MKGVTVSIDRIVIDFTDVYWDFFNEFHKHICHYFPEEYVDTHRLTLEVQTELNWSDELTKDVAQRIAKKQDYNLIVKEMKRKYGVDVLGGVAIIYTCYNAEGNGVTLNELFWGNSIDIPTVKGGFISPSLGLKKPGLNNMKTEMPKETPKPPNPSNTSKIEGMPPIVQSRINLRNGSAEEGAGFNHVLDRHFNPSKNASLFSITPDELKGVLQSKEVVSTPVSRVLYSDLKLADGTSEKQARYVREVTLDSDIGIDKFSGSPTNIMTVLTDKHGNLVTATPGVIK